MLKHIREALRLAGPHDVEYHAGTKHPYLVVSGKRIPVAASPKNTDHAARNIARDIIRARAS